MMLLGDEHLDELMCLDEPEHLSLGLDHRRYRTEALTASRAVCRVSRFVRNEFGKLGDGQLGESALLQLRRELVDHVQQATKYFPAHSFNPYFDALLLESQAQRYAELSFPTMWYRSSTPQLEFRSELQELAHAVRDRCVSAQFAVQMDARRRQLHSTLRSALAYTSEVLIRAPSVLVCQLDLFWSKGHPIPAVRAPSVQEFDEFRAALLKFVRYLKDRYRGAGYLFRIEYAMHRGFVARVFAFIPEPEDITARDVSGHLGHHWTHTLSAGAGGCAHVSWGGGPGLLPICIEDAVATSVLTRALKRMLCAEFWVRLTVEHKTFGRGQMP